MDFSFKKRPVKRLYGEYTILFIFLALCIFGTYLVTGHTFILSKDALNQHLPLLAKYREALISFVHHPRLNFWSWQMGLGSDTFQVYSYYTIGDVFSYLALLFPAAKITLAYQVINIIRMYCVGLAFVYFAQHFKFRNSVILMGATTYLVNSFLLYACIAQPFFTTPFIIFPLIVVQIERILEEGSPWPLVGAFTWMLVSNYYLAYVLGIGSFLYLVLRVGTHYRCTLNYGKTFLKLAFATITSVLLSAVLLVPEIIAVTNSTRTGSLFANGLKTYPLYYYLFLPKSLINGGQWYFMFWSALGIISIGFIALVYIYSRPRKYPLLTISLGLALIMLLIPAVGSFFNGMMSASNRWTLLIYLPLAMAVCILAENIPTLDQKTMAVLSWATGIYLIVLIATFFFENENDIFMPVIFLIGSLMAIWLIHLNKLAHPYRWLLAITMLNAGVNAIYAAFPYNGDFSSSMLSRGEYQAITSNRYGKLNQDLKNDPFYRVSTISQNKIIDGPNLDNDLTSGLHNIDSYYSLQNKYLGQFNTSLQNNQYQANIPIRQADDRTIMNNFFGVKYLFVQSNGDNATKIPAGYFLDKATDPVINYDEGQPSNPQSKDEFVPTQTMRYKTNYAFPLLYWQDNYISKKDYQSLSPTEKERVLATGVLVDKQEKLQGMKAAKLKTHVYPLKSELVSNRLNKINPAKLTYTDSEETYQLQLPELQSKKMQQKLKGSELHIEFSKIKYTPFSMKEQIAYEQAHLKETVLNPGNVINQRYTHYRYWRYHVLNGSPDISFKLNIGSKFGTATIEQARQSTLSLFKHVTNSTLNIGYYDGKLPTSLTFQPSKLGTYELKYRVVAEKIDNNYYREVKTLQRHRLEDVKFKRNQVQGTIKTTRPGVLTSSIPYSTGWSVKVNGKKATTLRTNQAFLGVYLPAGTHHVIFSYELPGIRLGALLSSIGLGWTILAGIITVVWKRKRK
ncbi:YfhO family protein [Lactobacillus reuteri]|uniref:YfhO family protein n=2 Tax=Limosilactobacillus reuteri TaxID=1598 RepID=UPI00146D9E8E|nr:YfhO family protein [Limosilactobacillus reuteri]NMV48738.1 YfhO family protein [Limosilactobacillus reuteri]NMV50399.1 YfhO family protein [Limosilactobacillus reuteri]NMV59988.1 YfhO family protein [Limosilactobacillus reuteri]NMV61805.1 YfhO family protein [Limosilactobacillus reuteri]NMV63537.1 YfhO family protein [Limosilactobacillus reuteri]